MVSGNEVEQNLRDVERLVSKASEMGARMVILPENFALLSTSKLRTAGLKETTSFGPIRSFVSALAKQHGLWVVAGSIPVAARSDGEEMDSRVRSACFVYDAQGNELARYDKIHLFDVDVDDRLGSYRESDSIEPGDQVKILDTPYGRLGLSICYDLRFPELYRMLQTQGAEIITVPSAFTAVTGAAHWEVLLRARAIENLCFVVGANQGGSHSETRESFGHSMIIDPWGKVLAMRERGAGVILADIDLACQRQVRQKMPVLEHRRLP